MMAGDIIFLGCRTDYKGAMDGARGGEYYLSKPLWSSGRYTPLVQPEFGPEENHFVSGNFAEFLCIFCRKDQLSCDGWAA